MAVLGDHRAATQCRCGSILRAFSLSSHSKCTCRGHSCGCQTLLLQGMMRSEQHWKYCIPLFKQHRRSGTERSRASFAEPRGGDRSDLSLPGALAAAVAPLQREDTERLESAGAHPILPAIFLELPQLAYLRLICGDQQLPQPPEGNAMLPAVGLQSVQVAVHAQLCFQAARCIINACTGKAKTEMTPSGFWEAVASS